MQYLELLQTKCDSFADCCSQENFEEVLAAISIFDGADSDYKMKAAKILSFAALNASNDVQKKLGNDPCMVSREKQKKYLDAQYRCLTVFSEAYALTDDHDLNYRISAKYVEIVNNMLNSKWTYFSQSADVYLEGTPLLSPAERGILLKRIDDWEEKREIHRRGREW